MKKKYDSDIKNNVNKLLDRIIIVLIVLIVISGVFLLIRKEEYNKTIIEINDSKLSVGAIEKEISVKEEIDSLKKKYNITMDNSKEENKRHFTSINSLSEFVRENRNDK